MTTFELNIADLAVLLAVVFLAGIAVGGGFMAGAYLGERGRRKDAQRREGLLTVDAARPAVIRDPAADRPGLAPELGEAPDRWIAETMAETGCTEEEAQEEWHRLVAQSFGDRAHA